MIAETLAGIALVKQSVDFIKSNISTVQDIGQIAGQIDDLFRGEQEVQKARGKKSGVGLTDQFGVQSVAKEMIDAKLAQEKMHEVAMMVDMRFGPGTWKGIVTERANRIKAAKEAATAARKAEALRQQELLDNIKVGALVVAVVAIAIGLFIALMVSTASAFIN